MVIKLLLIFLFFICLFITTFSFEQIDLTEKKEITVSISGCVLKEGEYTLDSSSTLNDLINLSVLKDDTCDLSMYNVNLPLKNGDIIYIPESQETVKISINSSSLEELCLLPGIGESTAQKIIDYRNENGFFQKIEDIKNIKGIGNSKFEKLKDYICL